MVERAVFLVGTLVEFQILCVFFRRALDARRTLVRRGKPDESKSDFGRQIHALVLSDVLLILAYYLRLLPCNDANLLDQNSKDLSSMQLQMILVLDACRQVLTWQKWQVPKALKGHLDKRVWICRACLRIEITPSASKALPFW